MFSCYKWELSSYLFYLQASMTWVMVVLARSPTPVPLCTVNLSPLPTPVSCPALNILKQGSVCLIIDPSLQMKLLCTPPASNSREPVPVMDIGLQLAQTSRGLLPGPDQDQFPQVINCRTGYSFKRRTESSLLLVVSNIPIYNASFQYRNWESIKKPNHLLSNFDFSPYSHVFKQ